MNTKNVLLGILIVIVFAVGFMVGRFSSVGKTYTTNPVTEPTSADSNAGANNSDEVGTETPEEGTEVQASNLSEGQKKLLGALGIDTNSITVTPEMIACAEARLGSARIDEITNGATPSFSEGLSLAVCYK